MESEYEYPKVGDRTSPKEWVEIGETDVVDKAHKVVCNTLSSHYPRHISDKMDEEIRAKFNIMIDRTDMTAGNGRWAPKN